MALCRPRRRLRAGQPGAGAARRPARTARPAPRPRPRASRGPREPAACSSPGWGTVLRAPSCACVPTRTSPCRCAPRGARARRRDPVGAHAVRRPARASAARARACRARDRRGRAGARRRSPPRCSATLLPARLPDSPASRWPPTSPRAGRHVASAATGTTRSPLPGGRLGLVIGDVSGHGVDAAARMGELRCVTRAYAWRATPPRWSIAR